MRHRMAKRKLGRTSSHRSALFRNQLSSMIQHERIVTTLPKAKELRPIVEKIVTFGKDDTVHARRMVGRSISDRNDIKRLFEVIAPRFTDRPGGYTRIIKLGPRRGDGAEMAILEFVDYQLEGEAKPAKPKKKKAAPKTEDADQASEETEESEEEASKKPAKKPAKKAASKKSSAKQSSSKKGSSSAKKPSTTSKKTSAKRSASKKKGS